MKKIFSLSILILFYSLLLFIPLSSFNHVRMNGLNVGLVVFILSSAHGNILASLHTKKYDVAFLLLYKIVSYFSCLYILILEDTAFIHDYYIGFDVDLLKLSIGVFKDFIFTGDSLFLVMMLWTFPIYIAISIVPFILLRMIKNDA